MNLSSHTCLLLLLASGLLAPSLVAAETPVPKAMPPIPPSPIEDFRRWLKLGSDEREKALADYSPAKREILRKKLQAYESMRPQERDARLQRLEFRWYLQPLMSAAPTERGNYLEMIPARLHGAIAARLQHWDSLREETRREILADEQKRELVIAYFAQVRRPTASRPPLPTDEPPHPRELEAQLKHWQTASPAERQRMSTHVSSFLDLAKADQRKALDQLSETERMEIQKTLDTFAQLSPEDRLACVNSFQKFATMTARERASFLRNAARWQQLTSEERATWRNIVGKLPPMPPEFFLLPPMPREALPGDENLAATNSDSISVN